MNQTNDRAHRRAGPMALLLLVAFAFIAGQTQALSHVHVDGEQTSFCAVCHHADKSVHAPLECGPASADLLPLYAAPLHDALAHQTFTRHHYLSRAPPVSS